MFQRLNRLRDHFARASTELSHMNRERLLLNPDKIVPFSYFQDVAVRYPDVDSPLHRTLYKSMPNILLNLERMTAIGEAPCFVLPLYRLPAEEWSAQVRMLDDYRDRMNRAYKGELRGFAVEIFENAFEKVRKEVAAGNGVLSCYRLGDLLEASYDTTGDTEFKIDGMISAYTGHGAKVVNFWKEINALKDWSGHFPDTPDHKRRKPRELPPIQNNWSWGGLNPFPT